MKARQYTLQVPLFFYPVKVGILSLRNGEILSYNLKVTASSGEKLPAGRKVTPCRSEHLSDRRKVISRKLRIKN